MFRGFVAFVVAGMLQASMATAQPLGTFKWQLQSYCNVISVVITQTGGVYTLDGFDDQCGTGKRAPVTGLATPNPDGTIGLGFNIIAAPGAAPVQVAASIDLATLGGTWRDSNGGSGHFVFTPGAGTGGTPRPLPSAGPVIPTTIKLFSDGGLVAGGGLAAKAQDAAIRHIGPTAQDFHAAFGLGEDPLRITTIDADGIALRAIQALEARLRACEARIQTLEQEILVMRANAGAMR